MTFCLPEAHAFWLIYSSNSQGEQLTPFLGGRLAPKSHNVRRSDLGCDLLPPCMRYSSAFNDTDGSVISPQFTDLDPDADDIAGPVTWSSPTDTSQVVSYSLFWNDNAGGVLVAELPVGTNSYTIPVSTNATYSEILIYSQSSFSLQSTPVSVSVADVDFSPQALAFVDRRLDAGELGGIIQWTAPNSSEVQHYNVYLAMDQVGTGRSLLGNVDASTYSFAYTDSATLQQYTHALAYTESSVGEQDLPSAAELTDTSASVSNLAFADSDADLLQIGGRVTWTPPVDSSQVTGYRLYLCEGSSCSSRAQLGSQVAVGTNQVSFTEVDVLETQTHIGAYTKSSLAEQSTPVSIVLFDSYISAGNISFTDVDVDEGQIGGNLSWAEPADISQVTGYRIYLGTGASVKISHLGDVAGAINTDFEVPMDTDSNGTTDLLVCLLSDGVEQSGTRATKRSVCDAYIFRDTTESVSGIAFQGKDLFRHSLELTKPRPLLSHLEDLDLNELGGTVSWTPPLVLVYTQQYVVYLAEDASGTARSQAPGGNELCSAVGSATARVLDLTATVQSDRWRLSLRLQSASLPGIGAGFPTAQWTLSLKGSRGIESVSEHELKSLLLPVQGTNELLVPADTPRLNFTHFVVYTQTAFQEQTTPASLAFDDAVAARNVGFTDDDLDQGAIGKGEEEKWKEVAHLVGLYEEDEEEAAPATDLCHPADGDAQRWDAKYLQKRTLRDEDAELDNLTLLFGDLEAAVLAAFSAEALEALDLPQLRALARRLTGAGGEWSGTARVARAYRAGLGAKAHLNGGHKISSPTLPGLRNSFYIVLRGPSHPEGIWTKSYQTYAAAVRPVGGPRGSFDSASASHSFPSLAEAEAYLLGAGRPIGRPGVEELALTVSGDSALPPLYLTLPAAEEGGSDRYATAFLLRVRANGFMVVLPDLPAVRDYVEGLLNEDGDRVALTMREQVQVETVRGRHLGPGAALLADFPWSSCGYFVRSLRGLPDRASRVLSVSVGTVPGRPMSQDALDTAGRWVERLDPDTAQEYWESAQEVDLEADVDGEPMDELAEEEPAQPAPNRALGSRALPAAARASQAPRTGAQPGGNLFNGGRAMTDAAMARLQRLAGSAPARVGLVERQRTAAAAPEEDLALEAEFGALPPADVQDPAEELQATTMQSMLLAQMRQNAILLEKLVHKGGALEDVLGGGSGSGGDSSGGGIKGHLAREAFLKQVSDLKSVANKVQNSALLELGMTEPEPGLMREFVEKRIPLADQKVLQHVAAIASPGWELGYRSKNEELMGFTSRLLMFVEQSALDGGKTQLGYLLSGFPDPTPLGFMSRRAPGLKSFSRLAPAQWMAANLDYAETRIAQLGNNRQPPPQKPQPPEVPSEDAEEPGKPPRRRPPRRPKNDAS
ncbi:unnamed protein product [Symbiodinium sp. CCMP2592]|nr:unnamed protein product [Symbiodinium sp. CCMP2592]